MLRAVHLHGRVWAISVGGGLRHADIATSEWLDAPALPAAVIALAPCEEREAVVAACRDGSLHLLHARSANILASAPAPLHAVPLCLLALPAENAVFAGLQDGAVVRVHLATLAFDCMLGCGVEHSAAVNALDADDQYLYSGGDDAVVLVWDLKEATAVREISMPSTSVRSLLRVDVALWVGLENGAVEVFDIFGDDTNGIERVSQKMAHAGPVTDLVRIGETEVWSVCAPPMQHELSLEHASSIAVWDTRDMNFEVSDASQADIARDVMTLTVIERVPLEEVTVLALSRSLHAQYLSKQVKGSIEGLVEEESESFETYSEFEVQTPLENSDDMGTLRDDIARHMPSYQQSLEDDRLELPYPDMFVTSPAAMPATEYPYEDNAGEANNFMRAESSDRSSRAQSVADRDAPSLVLPRSVSESLLLSLRRISELLVTLLTDDVLSPSEGHTRGPNDDLRSAVATITQELNIGRKLVETCVSGNTSDNSVVTVDENDLSRGERKENLAYGGGEHARLRKQLDKELESRRLLQKDLGVVTRERDLLAHDLQQLKSQSESSLVSLQGIIRENDSVVASKEALVLELRKECKQLETKCRSEAQQRKEVEESMAVKVDELSQALARVESAGKEHLATAYDKIETKSIEIQAQRDSIRATEKQLEALRASGQAMDAKCKQAEDNFSDALRRIQEIEEELAAKFVEAQQQHENEVERLNEVRELQEQSMQKKLDESLEQQATFEEAVTEKENVIVSLREEVEAVKVTLAETSSKAEDILKESQSELSEVTAANEKDAQRLEMENTHLRASLQQAKLTAEETLKSRNVEVATELATQQSVIQTLEKTIVELQEQTGKAKEDLEWCHRKYGSEVSDRQARVLVLENTIAELHSRDDEISRGLGDLEDEVVRLRDEKCGLQQELEHRVAASKLYEEEIGKVRASAHYYKSASDELRVALQTSEEETLQLQDRCNELRQQLRREQVEGGQFLSTAGAAGYDNIEEDDQRRIVETVQLEGSKNAMQALLASAHGEIEQMSNQIEAMHRTHVEQEKEIVELREALYAASNDLRTKAPSAGVPLGKPGGNVTERKGPGRDDYAPGDGGSSAAAEKREALAEDGSSSSQAESRADVIAFQDEVLVNSALQEVQEGMAMTQDKLRQLSTTARKFKRAALCHIEVLPPLYEVEVELTRMSGEDPRKGEELGLARGILHTVIAEYFSSSERRAVLPEFDEAAYVPSSQRRDALQQTVVQMRAARLGDSSLVAIPEDGVVDGVEDNGSASVAQQIPDLRRTLTF